MTFPNISANTRTTGFEKEISGDRGGVKIIKNISIFS